MEKNRNKKETSREEKKHPDFRLLFSALENKILKGEEPDRCRTILARSDVWEKLKPELQLRWARLAQMAGEIDLALEILAHINQTSPQLTDAWHERLELLSVLERKESVAQVLAAAKKYIEKETYVTWLNHGASAIDSPASEDEILSPFDRLRERQLAIQRFLELFSGREDCFARQWADRTEGKQGYVPVRRPMCEADVEEHISGRKTFGIYLLRADSTVKVAVIDVDIIKRYRTSSISSEDKALIKRERSYLISRIKELEKQVGITSVVEFSGSKGYHFWYFFESPVKASVIRAELVRMTRTIEKDLTAFQLEVFPKQDRLSGKGFGNLVKLPLGIHRLTGKRSYFIDCQDRGTDAQLNFLTKIKKCMPKSVSSPNKCEHTAEVLIHPKLGKWSEEYPELMEIEVKCPPIGQIIASCRNRNQLSMREEKVLFQTLGFLPRARILIHHLFSMLPEYNPHMVNYKLSRLRGKPLGCKRIHSLLDYSGDMCHFSHVTNYPHPLLHFDHWEEEPVSEKVKDLNSALENLKIAIMQVEAFLK